VTAPAACLLGVSFLVAGCGDDKRAKAPAPVRSASDSLRGPAPALGQPLVFRKRYFFMRRRQVEAVLTPSAFTARVNDPYLYVPRGQRPFRLALRWEDRGRDPFPLDWARFSLRGEGRAPRPGFSYSPIRRISPTDKSSPKTTILTFLVPRAFHPRELRISSIVRLWKFRARWRLG
jgi:hypothetical protein